MRNSPWAMTLMLRMLVGLSMSPRIWSVKIGGLHVVPRRETRLLTYGEVAANAMSNSADGGSEGTTYTMAVYDGGGEARKEEELERWSMWSTRNRRCHADRDGLCIKHVPDIRNLQPAR